MPSWKQCETLFRGILLLLVFNVNCAQPPDKRAPAISISAPYGTSYEVHQYRESIPPRSGEMGIAYPVNAKAPLPVIICIHGCGWSKGDKDQLAWMAIRYARRGYVGVTVSYRLTHEAPVPACLLDVKEAIRYLKSIPGRVPLDSRRIALLGYSAGGHLALMAGLSPDAEIFRSEAFPERSSSVQCVVAVSAPADLEERYKREGRLRLLPEDKSTDLDFIRSLSPLDWIHPDQIPVLMLHGDKDPLVQPYNYQNFAEKCRDSNIRNFELYVHENGKHMFFFKEQKVTLPIVNRFLRAHLK